jgi:hypothetical protein
MASWILVPCLVKLRSEFNVIAPNRMKDSDGSVGDAAHQDSQSDHNPDETGNVPIHDPDRVNEVHAIDVDIDLKVPGLSMEKVVQFLLARCRAGTENRLRYIIFNRRIWSASDEWRERDYTGKNPHDKHAHFSSSYASGREADTSSWELEAIPVALTADDKKWISAEITKIVRAEGVKTEEVLEAVPTAAENATAIWNKVRTSPVSMLSDTAINLQNAQITEAVKEGVAIERFPANEGK